MYDESFKISRLISIGTVTRKRKIKIVYLVYRLIKTKYPLERVDQVK